MRFASILLPIVSMAPLAVVAAEPPGDVARVTQYCSASGGFGERFGADRTVGASRRQLQSSLTLEPVGSWPPFDTFEVVVTYESRLLHTVTATAPFADDAAARTYYRALDGALTADPRFVARRAMGDDMLEFFAKPIVADEAPRDGLKVKIVLQGSTVDLYCTDAALEARTFDEFRGDGAGKAATDPGPMPPRPAATLPPRPAPKACAAPATRTALVADFPAAIERTLDYGRRVNDYARELAEWKGKRLVARGRWDEEAAQNFRIELASGIDFKDFVRESASLVERIVSTAQKFEAAKARGDELAACSSAAAALDSAHELVTVSGKFWDYVAREYDAFER